MISDYSGRWETEDEIQRDLTLRLKAGKVSFIDFEISPSTCARVIEYLREYQVLGYDKNPRRLRSPPARTSRYRL